MAPHVRTLLILVGLATASGCSAARETDDPLASEAEEVVQGKPEIWIATGALPGEITVGSRGLPASASDGTVAVITETQVAGKTAYTLDVRSENDWRQYPLVVVSPDGTLAVRDRDLQDAQAELAAKAFQPFTASKVNAVGSATANGYRVSIAGTDLRREDAAGVAVSTSLADELAEISLIDGCAYAPQLVEAYVSQRRNLFYAKIDYTGGGADCPGGGSYWALPLTPRK